MNRQASLFLLLTLFIKPLLAVAGTIAITGQGESSSPPDMYSIELKVNSICYETTQQAKLDNARIANQLIAISQKYARNSKDKVTTHPGSFIRSTEYLPSESGHSKILCERKWKTWNTISLTIHDIQSLAELQDELVTFLAPIEMVQPEKQEQTFIHLSSPHFGLTKENLTILRKQAQQSALQDAKDQFQNFDVYCHFKSAKLNSVTPPSFTSTIRYGAKMAESSESSTPVIPENITVTAIWNFIWEFELAPGCYN